MKASSSSSSSSSTSALYPQHPPSHTLLSQSAKLTQQTHHKATIPHEEASAVETCLKQIVSLCNHPFFLQQHQDRLIQLTDNFMHTFQRSGDKENDVNINTPDSSMQVVPFCCSELKSVLATLSNTDFDQSDTIMPLELNLVKVLKIILKNEDNRKSLGKAGVDSIMKLLQMKLKTKKTVVIAELCSVVLHACYDKGNVSHVANCSLVGQNGAINGTMLLLNCIYHRDVAIVASAMGALQALCYVPQGRMTLRHNFEVLNKLVTLLVHKDATIRARSLGTIHNLSVDAVSINPLINTGCISIIVHLLETISQPTSINAGDENVGEIISTALGTLQNLTRDQEARALALDAGAMHIVSKMLMSSYVSCQIAALGAFMNLAPTESQSEEDQKAMKELLTEVIALGAIQSCLFENNV